MKMKSVLLSISWTELLLVLCSPASIHLPASLSLSLSLACSLALYVCQGWECVVQSFWHLSQNSLIIEHNQTPFSKCSFFTVIPFLSKSVFFCSSFTVILHAFMSLSFSYVLLLFLFFFSMFVCWGLLLWAF